MSDPTLSTGEEAPTPGTPLPWKLWNGWGPHTDGLMRARRIGPFPTGGLFVSPASGDIAGLQADLEYVVYAANSLPSLLERIAALEQQNKTLAEECEAKRDVATDWYTTLRLLDRAEARIRLLERERDEAREIAAHERSKREELQRDLGASWTFRERFPWETASVSSSPPPTEEKEPTNG